jgi:integrase/recombinase XerD
MHNGLIKDKRTGRKQVIKRMEVKEVGLPSFTLSEAVQYVIVLKRAKNLKERTVKEYLINMQYFIEWVIERYGEIPSEEITSSLLRQYVLWCSNEKDHYGGHPFKQEYGAGRKGLSASSVNVRIRILKTFFNELYEENIIDHNPVVNLSLMRQDIDTVQPLNMDELKRLLRTPEKKYFA